MNNPDLERVQQAAAAYDRAYAAMLDAIVAAHDAGEPLRNISLATGHRLSHETIRRAIKAKGKTSVE